MWSGGSPLGGSRSSQTRIDLRPKVAPGPRPSEVLTLRWPDVDLLGDPPTVTVSGTLIDHGRIAGKPLHRQDSRKGDAPLHTVVLPKFGVETLTTLVGESGVDGPVLTNRDGGWMSLANMQRAMRAALPDDLLWVTPHSFRRTVATVVRDAHGPAIAQQQLSHAKLATTETHYLQVRRGDLTRGMLSTTSPRVHPTEEGIRKVSSNRSGGSATSDVTADKWCARRDSNP